MKSRTAALPAALAIAMVTSAFANARSTAYDKVLAEIGEKTGLKPVDIPGTQGSYLGKTHRGYEVIYTAKAGNVWGRYVARLTAAEIGHETGGLLAFVTGHHDALGDRVVGSPFDRLLSSIIGQPLSVTIILKHQKPGAPRLDILSGYSVIKPEEQLPEQAKVGFKAGSIYSADAAFASRVAANSALMKRMKSLRGEYVRVDEDAVTLLWSGSETDYSGMIMDHGGYYKMLNDMMDDLADIADAIPAGKQKP